MYYNEEHKKKVIERGDGCIYIGSYRCGEITVDNKYDKSQSYIRVKCPYCGEEYDVRLKGFNKGNKCANCCNTYENSFAYYIQQELKEPLNKYWDWEKNNELGINPYHIKPQSNKKVWIKCAETDYHDSYFIMVSKFYKGNRCSYCHSKKVHPKDSFGQWLIDTYGEDAIEKYWSPKNTLNPFKISKRSTNKIYMLCQDKDYHNDNSGYKITAYNFYDGKRCPYCNGKKVHSKDSFAQWGTDTFGDDFLEKYWSNKNTINPWEITPQSNKKVWIYCQEKDYHNDEGGYEIIVYNFYKGQRCSYCSNHKVHPKDSFGSLYPEKAKYWSKNNDKTPFEITLKSNYKYKFICEKCGEELERRIDNLNRSDTGVICRKCNSSKGETKIRKWLDKNNIKYIHDESYFDNLIGCGNGLLRPDFILPKERIWIEYDGEQHFELQSDWQTIENFKSLQKHDKIKNKYAKEHDWKLIRIPYWEFDNIEEILNKYIQ